jgi:hypothetical protein
MNTFPPSTDNSDQSSYVDNQDASIDIDQIYTSIIQEIDKYRSHVSVANNAGLLKFLIGALATATQSGAPANITDPNTYISQIKVDNNPQESRCHAFYRLIGLPVVAPTQDLLYNPGYDAANGFNNAVINKHLQVIQNINSQLPALFTLMDDREINANAFAKIFALSNPTVQSANINASVLALSSVAGGVSRDFSASLENSTDPFDTDAFDQSYTVLDLNSVSSAKLSAYTGTDGYTAMLLFSKDASGQLINPDNTGFLKESPLIRRAHILKPFMVDPRVDLTVNPPSGLVCVPFVTDSSKTIYAGGNTGNTASSIKLITPFLEYVMRARFNVSNTTGVLTQRYKDLQSYISSTNAVTDQTLLDQISSGLGTTLEDQVLEKNINIMRAMVKQLLAAIQKVQEIESQYHWLPIPDPVQGIEANIGTQDILLQVVNGNAQLDPLSTQIDQQIFNLQATIQLSNINTQNIQPDLGGFAFSTVQPLPDSSVSTGFGSNNQKVLDQMSAMRTDATNNAANALRTIEIIMGEYTGLGLCDIICIFTALWTVDPNVLVNMLDDEAFSRLYANPAYRTPQVETRQSNGSRTLSAQTMLQMFESQVKLMYSLMDKIRLDMVNGNIQ